MLRITFMVAVLALITSRVEAQRFFHFISDEDMEVLATVGLSDIPTEDPRDIVSFTFTPAGEDIFGFGPIYQGDFDVISSPGNRSRIVTSPSDGGLGGLDNDNVEAVSIIDLDPPLSDVGSFSQFSFSTVMERSDAIGASGFFVSGRFLPVPEPNCFLPLLVSMLLILPRKKRD